MRNFSIVKYKPQDMKVWDNFVLNSDTVLGTFLHTRNFLEYHPKDRFTDCSLLIYENNSLIAVIPACEIMLNGKKTFFSHKGSTFGGPVILKKRYNAEYVCEIIQSIEAYCKQNYFEKIYIKITPRIYCSKDNELLVYLFSHLGFNEYKELGTYIDFRNYNNNLLSNFEQGKRTNVNNCIKEKLEFKELENESYLGEFYSILCQNLQKYNVKPVHTISELLDFKRNRLAEIVEFYGVFNSDKMIAGGMIFNFKNTNMLHTQYLCADSEFNKLSPMTFLYYSIIEMAKNRNCSGVSWGSSTEKEGEILNLGLISSKEAYGSSHYLYNTFYKEL